ncbi:MAG: Hsp70 family protein [Paracoccaceae bacterium]|nr:Hsp70 family protein [Paracoccaceae bacterium]MDE2675312.1 Hsp70 family protein [Paracoccaceae bacterium]
MYIGIDLGTTNSAIAGFNNSEVRIYKTSEGSDTLPSVVYIDKRGHKLYGKRAYDQTLLSPENVASGFKRLMGTSTKIELKASSQSLSPEECSAQILKQLIGQIFTESGIEEITGAVITIPAAFNQMQSEATIRSARLADLDKVVLLQEPIAAAMASMSSSKNKNGQFLTYDLGGGTFDLALVQSISGDINIIAHEGINMLGGRDFDRIVVNSLVRPWLLENFELPKDFQKHEKYRRLLGIANLATEKAKIELSTKNSEVIFASDEEIRVLDEVGNEIYLDLEITRTDLEKLISEEIQKTIELTRKTLKENGYSHLDIDRIVFIGGPTKMPFIRETVPNELGIPADLQVDPMTAVAKGAAIFCESRDWSKVKTSKKSSRASHETTGKIKVKFDYGSRSSDEKTKVRLTSIGIGEGFEIQIDSNTGWTSGRILLTDKTSIELQLVELGENVFRATVFDNSGKPVAEAETEFVITRTLASSVGIPATQTIAVKVREGANILRNKLINILDKGTLLPAKGCQRFRAARDLSSGDDGGHLDFELYQNEGVVEPELNLRIGAFRISGKDLEYGMRIREGDEIIFHWEMNDSGLFFATVELPSLAQSFDTPKFYVDQVGHQSFDLDQGFKMANLVLDNAKLEFEKLNEAIGEGSGPQYEEIENDLDNQENTLEYATEGDVVRGVTENIRHIRQKISKLKNSPENRGKVLKQEILSKSSFFDIYNRDYADSKVSDRFDRHKSNALSCIDREDHKAIFEAEAHIKEIDSINFIEMFKNPDILLALFRNAESEEYLASDQEEYLRLLHLGNEAIETNNINDLRRVILSLNDLKINVAGPDQSLTTLASIMAV